MGHQQNRTKQMNRIHCIPYHKWYTSFICCFTPQLGVNAKMLGNGMPEQCKIEHGCKLRRVKYGDHIHCISYHKYPTSFNLLTLCAMVVGCTKTIGVLIANWSVEIQGMINNKNRWLVYEFKNKLINISQCGTITITSLDWYLLRLCFDAGGWCSGRIMRWPVVVEGAAMWIGCWVGR